MLGADGVGGITVVVGLAAVLAEAGIGVAVLFEVAADVITVGKNRPYMFGGFAVVAGRVGGLDGEGVVVGGEFVVDLGAGAGLRGFIVECTTEVTAGDVTSKVEARLGVGGLGGRGIGDRDLWGRGIDGLLVGGPGTGQIVVTGGSYLKIMSGIAEVGVYPRGGAGLDVAAEGAFILAGRLIAGKRYGGSGLVGRVVGRIIDGDYRGLGLDALAILAVEPVIALAAVEGLAAFVVGLTAFGAEVVAGGGFAALHTLSVLAVEPIQAFAAVNGIVAAIGVFAAFSIEAVAGVGGALVAALALYAVWRLLTAFPAVDSIATSVVV